MSAAEVIEKHGEWYGYSNEFGCYARFCGCAMWMDSSDDAKYSRASHARHVLDALKLAGYAVVKVPAAPTDYSSCSGAVCDLEEGGFSGIAKGGPW